MSRCYSYSSSLWLNSLLPPWRMPYHCLRQVGVIVTLKRKKINYHCLFLFLLSCCFRLNKDEMLQKSPHLFHYINCPNILPGIWSSKSLPCSCSLFLSCFSEGSHVFHRVLELLCDAVLLLGDSVCELVWDDRSLVGMELASQNTTHDSLLCRWMDTLHWKGELGWPPDNLPQTHRHTVLNCQGEL